jgi:molybdopterin synthase catalytic subunit
VRVEVVAFAALREALGRSRLELDLPDGATGAELRSQLASLHPQLHDLIHACRLAQGVEFLEETNSLNEGDEIILIPPVSGGNLESTGSGGNPIPSILLTRDSLDGDLLVNATRRNEAGAVVVFEGTVRSPSEGQDVDYLEYEAYEEMAVAHMERIVAETRKQWPVTAVHLYHRLGRIEVGEASVIAVASAPHRGQAFEACRFLIERLKADVPIWKKEYFSDGSVWVGAPGECREAT